ncbi:bifunctional serine/threonine-protein kinase/glutamate ABC transporter substrate-binding protein, partial [Actinophytocola sp.]|uniref:bifunctional serine/threonine-protein kinase/glutamate ABC transporter substrate-binding protein n=1 Tax=Actinophytocola sp. TaxID=1872138 RepID=UPI002EDAA95B
MPQPEDRLVAGRYRLLGQLGRGGMGVVWRATDELLERAVALKEVQLTESDPGYQRTLREARAAARLSHPGIVTVHDVVVDAGKPWIVMELVGGRSLADVVGRDGPLPADRVAELARRLLAALGTAHERGILHRDVKPANVLLDGDRVVLTDFGIASVEGGTAITATNQLIGSPQYLSPERVNGHAAAAPSDLWALGVTLYYALTGTSPFQRGDTQAVLAAVLTQEPPPVPSPLWTLLAGLLRKNPAERLTIAGAAAVLTPPPPQPPPVRNRRAPAFVALGLVVLLAVAVVGWTSGPNRVPGNATAAARAAGETRPSVPGSPTFERMTARGTVVIGVRDDQPGLGERMQDGSFRGFDIEIATQLAAGLGFGPEQITFMPVESGEREDRLTSGAVDLVVGSYVITDKRKESVGFAGPYLTGGQDVLVRTGFAEITGRDTLRGHKVCSVLGSSSAQVLRTEALVEPENIVELPDYAECVNALLATRVDAVTTDDALLKGFASTDPGRLHVVGEPWHPFAYGIGLPHDDKPLRDKLNDLLQAAIDDGTWQEVYDRTLGRSGTPAR